jgi:hypothetical protein
MREERLGDSSARLTALVLPIDQAHELLASEYAAESQRFISLLENFRVRSANVIEPLVLLTNRATNSAQLIEALRGWGDSKMITLRSLPQSSYRDVILRPLEVLAARGQRLKFDPALVDRLVRDASGADALALLSLTLSVLYREFRAEGHLTVAQYEALGGPAGIIGLEIKRALANPYDAPAIPPAKEGQLALLHAILIPWLVRIDPIQGGPVRRTARLDEFPEKLRAMIKRLVDARLLVIDRQGTDVVEIAHDVLITQWPPLAEWLQSDVHDLVLMEGIERAAREWAANGRGPTWLDHRGERLYRAERVAKREDFRRCISGVGIAYLDACRANDKIAHPQPALIRRIFLRPPQRISAPRPDPQPLGSKVFISYRRSDTRHVAGRVSDRLIAEFLAHTVFFVFDMIPVGVNFKQHISSAVHESAVMLVLIGEKWVNQRWKWRGIWQGKEDYVQSEIELAFDSGLPIFPILVDGVSMPSKDELPQSIADIVFLNAATIRSGKDFRKDMDYVLNKIKSLREQQKESAR